MNTDREQVRERLVDYVDGTLSPEARRLVDAALAADPELAAEVADLREAIRLASTLAAPVETPHDLEARVRAAVDGSARPVVRWLLPGGVGIAAAAVLVFALLDPFGGDRPPSNLVRVESKQPVDEVGSGRDLQKDFERLEPTKSRPAETADADETLAKGLPVPGVATADAPAPAAPKGQAPRENEWARKRDVRKGTPLGARPGAAADRPARGSAKDDGSVRARSKKARSENDRSAKAVGADAEEPRRTRLLSADAPVVAVTVACPAHARPSVIEALVRAVIDRRLATAAVRVEGGLALRVDVPGGVRAALVRTLIDAGVTGGLPAVEPSRDEAWIVRIPKP